MVRADEPAHSPWAVRSWRSDEGLPNNMVLGIAQTPDGYLWFATSTRVARFDGVRFDAAARDVFGPEFAPHTVGALTESRDGGLWLLMNQGPLVHAQGGELRFIASGLPAENVLSVTEDGEGGVWLTYRGETVWRVRGGKVKQLTAEDGLPGRTIASFARDPGGTLWFVKGGVIGVTRGDRLESLAQLPKLNVTARVAPARAGGVWVATNNQLFRYTSEGGLVDCGIFQPDQRGDEARALLEDRNGGVWIGTATNALFHYDGRTFEPIATSHREILCLLEDREGSIWAGTGGGGADQIRPRTLELATAPGMPLESVQSLTEDTAGRLWAAAQNGSLLRHDPDGWVNVSALPESPPGLVSTVAADRQGGVWIGTRNRLLHHWVGGAFTTWRDTSGLGLRNIHTLFVARNGDVYIAGNGPEMLQRWRDGKIVTLPLPANVRVIRAAAEDTAGQVWFGTSRGLLLRIDGDRVIDETPLMGSIMSIRCLTADPAGGLWIGFADFGVGRLQDGHFARVASDQGLPDDGVSQILIDDHDWIWCGANQGIFKVRRDELDQALASRNARVRPIVFGRSDGVPSLQAMGGGSPNTVKARDGRLWMTMTSGLVAINPQPVRDDPGPLPVLLRSVTVDDVVVASYGGPLPVSAGIDLRKVGAGLRLPPEHRRMEFEWTALSFSAPENVRFRYKLDGFDDTWTDGSARHVATYSRLPAGHYAFRVQAALGSGNWSEMKSPLVFVVEPFLWQTWWFQLAVLAGFTASIAATVRYVSFRRLRSRVRALEQQAALEKERARIARDIHDDVGNRLTKITLLSGLALQDRTEPERAAEHIAKISSTARQITDSLDEIVWAVNPRNDTLSHLIDYIGQFALEFLHAAGLKVALDLPERAPERMVPAEVRHNLFLVVKEALNNTVRHAQAQTVQVRIATTAAELVVTITDDGRGFARGAAPAAGDGLRNMRQRITEIGGEFDLQSTPGGGTAIRLQYRWVALQRN
jgi:signal transduction histidine kinase/ligand-binding sensor domain-containing protein